MKRTLHFLCIAIALFVSSSCASIVSKSNWPVDVGSSPAGATVTITNQNGAVVYRGMTPGKVSLKSGAGFFKKASYTVKFEMEGYNPLEVPLTCKLNGWYFGNLVFGGLIGFLIVDPATGAMYKLSEPFVDGSLTKNSTGAVNTEHTLKICTIGEIPKSMQGQLVKIN